MLVVRRQRMSVVIACMMLALLPHRAFTQEEEGRPVRRVEDPERRRLEERRPEDEKRLELKPVTEVERVGRDIDLTEHPNGDTPDANELDRLIKQDEAREVKFDEKIKRQIIERGWSLEEIRELVKGEPAGVSIDSRSGKEEPATVYGRRGEYIVINDETRYIIQISNKKTEWLDDPRIKWK